MCTHGRFITNKYTGTQFFCKCGHCKSCLQEKAAARSNRIRNEYSEDYNVVFVTLTYNRQSVPFIYRYDLWDRKTEINVYRSYKRFWNVDKQKFLNKYEKTVLTTVVVDDNYGHTKCKDLQKQKGRIGVCYYPDLQNFLKRLRQNLNRDYGIQNIKCYNVFEYSGKTQRPHFHLLLFTPFGTYEKVRLSVIKAWPYDNRIGNEKSIQLVTGDPAGYVASYINCGRSISPLLTNYFKPKSSHSLYFGHGKKSFTLPEIQKKIERGDLTYTVQRVKSDEQGNVTLPIPKYVINRYFPLFKGYSRLANSSIYDYILRNFDYDVLWSAGIRNDMKYYNFEAPIEHNKYKIDYSKNELLSISTRFRHAFEYYRSIFPDSSLQDYALAYDRVWKQYKSTCYRLFATDDSCHPFYKYDNLCFVDDDTLNAFVDSLGSLPATLILNPNEYPHRIAQTAKMTQLYDKYDKQKKVSAMVQFENDCFT